MGNLNWLFLIRAWTMHDRQLRQAETLQKFNTPKIDAKARIAHRRGHGGSRLTVNNAWSHSKSIMSRDAEASLWPQRAKYTRCLTFSFIHRPGAREGTSRGGAPPRGLGVKAGKVQQWKR